MDNIAARTKELCRIYDIKPARSKGQNFLINDGIYKAIIKASDLKPEETVVEVGPGLGFLTAELARAAKRVIAVELDDKLAGILTIAIDSQDVENVEIVNQDILRFNPSDYLADNEDYRVVANLPYNITSIFLRTFLSSARPPRSLVLMLQKEVAERIVTAEPDMSLLSLSIHYYGKPEIIRTVPATDFWPAPAVDSAILRFDYERPTPTTASIEEDKNFFRIARIGFAAKRKMLKNNLVGGLKISAESVEKAFQKADIPAKARAEALSVEEWRRLVAALSDFVL
ncbi:ribosomal RNA small subunit methyltransferase A [Candidatus Falkowbacteria bacterium HGW-Falkowbacteria-2]|uniref:Ribosomal RNA small subunit methyltransferase A n=1 Tax=Candidatus Falkowbacteria bacterium HGW-Falkowbacteria-2 TaxID=2013769 RepID=A0A2N2E0P6_9BACT|nr:MAG: ribosomal RNA small subunit methyltransferase A [Candidatus Falkowbacteria bacterium HGW-Falkowbacteria-2]